MDGHNKFQVLKKSVLVVVNQHLEIKIFFALTINKEVRNRDFTNVMHMKNKNYLSYLQVHL